MRSVASDNAAAAKLLLVLATFAFLSSSAADECRELSSPDYAPAGLYPITALASFQGSGNTWLRLMLAQLTGIKVGDMYQSIGNDRIPEFSSRSDSTVIAVKTHHYDVSLNTADGRNPFERAVIIIRHPLNGLLAEFHRLYGGNKTGYADPKFFFNADGSTTWKWDVWLTRLIVWIEFHEYWINRYHKPVHVVSYNGLRTNLRDELVAIAEFLGVPLNQTRLDCAVRRQSAMFVRDRKNARLTQDQLRLIFSLALDRADRAVLDVKHDIRRRWGADSAIAQRLDIAVTYD